MSSSESTPMSTPESSIYASSHLSDLSFSQSSLVEHPATPSNDSALSSFSDDDDASTSTESMDDAELEWQESLQQLELLLSLVLIPFIGKYIGRRCAYWAWAKFMTKKYPVDTVLTNRKVFNVAGTINIGALSSPSAPL